MNRTHLEAAGLACRDEEDEQRGSGGEGKALAQEEVCVCARACVRACMCIWVFLEFEFLAITICGNTINFLRINFYIFYLLNSFVVLVAILIAFLDIP